MATWRGHAAFYASSFAVLGVYMQFFPAWLHEQRGLSEAEIALVLSATTIARTFAGPLWSRCVDRRGDARRVLLLLSSLAFLVMLAFAAVDTLPMFWCVAFAYGCSYPPMLPILDAASVRASRQHGFSFGRLRTVGSLSFLLTIVVAGVLLERFGTRYVWPMSCVLLATVVLGAVRLPRGSSRVLRVAAASASPAAIWPLLRVPGFMALLLAAALIQGSHAPYYNLSTVHWNAHGIDKSTAAVLWAEGVLAEIVLFFWASRWLERLRPTSLLLLGGLGAAVRWLIVGWSTSVPLLFATGWLHALSFGTTYLGAIRFIEVRVPDGLRATAQGVVGAATSGLGMVVCGLLGGFAYARIAAAAFWLMAAVAALGAGAAWWARRPRGEVGRLADDAAS